MIRWFEIRKCKLYSECKSDAAYKLPHANLYLCKEHFLLNVEKRVKKFIEKKHLIHPWNPEYSKYREKILVALSGGKDSQVLLHILKKLYPEEHIEGVYIELGISNKDYSKDSGLIAQRTCEKMNIPFHIIDVKEKYGFNIDDIAHLKYYFKDENMSLGRVHFKGICSYCGMFKRYTINQFAYDNGYTCVATGHNLTDETASLVNNFFNQSIMFLSRMNFKSDAQIEGLVPRIKPLYYIAEEEIMMYAYYANIEHLPTECIYSLQAKNLQLKNVLAEIEEQRKGTLISLMRRYQKVMKPILEDSLEKSIIGSERRRHYTCNSCGSATFSKRCNFCKTMNFLTERFNQVKNRSAINASDDE